MAQALTLQGGQPAWRAFVDRLNGQQHKIALQVFMVIVLGHWAEHVVQAVQIWVLGWPRPQALGLLGLIWPWLVSSESLHYGYALVMLIGLILLRPAFTGLSRTWWNISLGIQIWHHFEHLLLISQVIVGANLFGSPVPMSILQLIFPRVELHLTYNAMVFFPMAVAMYYHLFPPKEERTRRARAKITCTCAHSAS